MSINPELVDAYREAFRAAIGIDVQEAREETLENLSHAPMLTRLRYSTLGFFGFGPTASPDHYYHHRILGWKRLRDLINQGPGIYPRGEIFYDINGYGDRLFEYHLVFPGESIRENGTVQFEHIFRKVWLKRGKKSLVEIAENGGHILHLREKEGIVVRSELGHHVPMGLSGEGREYALTTWYPDLFDTPQLFSGPSGGETVWNVSNVSS